MLELKVDDSSLALEAKGPQNGNDKREVVRMDFLSNFLRDKVHLDDSAGAS